MKTLAALVLCGVLGCGSVTAEAPPAPDAGGAAGELASGGSTGAAGAPGGAGGAGLATGGTGSAAGAPQQGSGGAGGAQVVSLACGSGPELPGDACSNDGQCISGTCAGGWCTTCSTPNCTSEKAAAPPTCIANGWIPSSVTDCGTSSAPICSHGYRCLDCGPLPGHTPPCVYDRQGTSICVASCSDCAAP